MVDEPKVKHKKLIYRPKFIPFKIQNPRLDMFKKVLEFDLNAADILKGEISIEQVKKC